MNIGSIVHFNDERFFEGAVQLGWLEKRPEQALRAAESFVFHGPKYHGANSSLSDGIDSHYRLKDTASFVQDLLHSIVDSGQGREVNPYWLVVAGYGSGKSHLALTCASLLSNPLSPTAQTILQQLSSVDKDIGSQIDKQLKKLDKPALVLPLDGMSGFHLGNALSQSVFKQLSKLGIDAEPLRSLSPRFNIACKFVERNYDVRKERFLKSIPDFNEKDICQLLLENDEAIYEAVDAIYTEANGQPIPIEGQESAQELIDTLSKIYCGADGPFSQIVIMFDEFGRYLEYAADKPHLAGDAALQQIFQGIQDNSDKVRFVGFIQYELKTYLKRFGGAGLRQLQRYITRFDAAEKWYLSTNLETIFAHMIHKDESELEKALSQASAYSLFQQSHENLSLCLPSFSRYPVWQNSERFAEVIGRGCWPLHPMAVWFLTRQKDVVQSRSALTFIKDTIARVSRKNVVENGIITQVSAAELVLSNMLPELVAAEREVGGTVAETLQTLLEKFSSHLGTSEQLVLAGVATLEKMRIGKYNQNTVNTLLREATVLSEEDVLNSLDALSELGALEWNRDLGQYELLTDGASRGQFQQWLRKQPLNDSRNLFMRRAASEDILSNIETDFALSNGISTQDWFFDASFAHSGNLSNCLKQSFKEWSEACLPTEAKGKVIYLYIGADDEKIQIDNEIQRVFKEQLTSLNMEKAPIWVIGLNDQDGSLIDNLGKQYLFEEGLNEADKERFRRFIPDEIQRSKLGIKVSLTSQIKQHDFWIAGFKQVPTERLKKIGKVIFSTIYTKAISFEFDGFANRNGGGNPDSATLMRGLISKQFDGSWVQSQPIRLRNRINTLMAQSWGVLSREGKLSSPRSVAVREVLSDLLQAHQDNQSLNLKESYKKLMRPPYGMNSASAGLLLSMLVGLDSPPRRLEYNRKLISTIDWIDLVFPKKSHQLNESILELTSILFLSESSESRWRELFDRWELAETYESHIQLLDEMRNFNKVDPIPEHLEGTYKYWNDIGEQTSSTVSNKKSEISKLERDLERLASRVSVGPAIDTSKRLFVICREFDHSGLWPDIVVNDALNLLEVSRSLFEDQLKEWIPRQTCKGILNLGDFRRKMEGYEKSLKLLGYEKQAHALRDQMVSSIHRVEKIQEYQLTISQCVDYPRQPEPNALTLVRVLRDDIAQGDKLISTLKGAFDTFTKEEIEAHIKAIEGRQKILRQSEKDKREELGVLYNVPNSEHDLREMLQRTLHLQKVFVETRDEQELSEILYQLNYILKDIQNWPEDDVSATRLESLLKRQSEIQEKVFLENLEEQDIETAWTESIYKIISDERIRGAFQRSKEWADTRYLSRDEIRNLDINAAKSLQLEIVSLPSFIADSERQQLASMEEVLNERVLSLEVEKRSNIMQKWLSTFEDLDVQLLAHHDITRYLKEINSPPFTLNAVESATALEVEKRLQSALDTISVDNILQRISQLSRGMQKEILMAIEVSLTQESE
ncbi:hypothetical protein BCS96_09190 [Vibrio breoganii]|uniref:hypothetical protein n=1 Tax=Vibrio breoganii TaxID=553239 RepID=UPI000C841CC6|nr:hypothetical protein [Vibrio breoganii]PML88782.1 hypothetical protein BCT68_04700 [Vibrio breoganii]PMO99889.1 hypothetical protein BCS96_09190 [Vibrio breoganii]